MFIHTHSLLFLAFIDSLSLTITAGLMKKRDSDSIKKEISIELDATDSSFKSGGTQGSQGIWFTQLLFTSSMLGFTT